MVASGPIGPDAHFSNFAVSSEYQGKGFGKELFLDAIKDCEDRSVNRITLYTTEQASWKLEAFYEQNGFSWLNWRAFIMRGATFWSKRLRPHPAIIFTSGIFKWLNNGFKGE